MQAIFEDFRRGFINRHGRAENVNPGHCRHHPAHTIKTKPTNVHHPVYRNDPLNAVIRIGVLQFSAIESLYNHILRK
ncbi:Uncharacterised protein [Klebsiella oxytoca]|nr:Uncharacterised protein [Klebsiella oxytoca]